MARLDRSTFDRLVRQHHAAVYRSALRVVRNERDAEDVAQDVFLLGGKVPLQGAEEPRAALCWLATRLGLNLLRGARRRQHKENQAIMQQAPITPAQQAGEAELHGTVRTLVRDLPDDLRLPLLLRYQDELTFRSVGSALAISESTAHERVQQALERLRRLLSGMGFALAPVRLPELVAAPQAASVPAGLKSRLLDLADAAPVAAALAAKAAVAAVLLAGAAAVVWAVASPGDPVKDDHTAIAVSGPLAARVVPEPMADSADAMRTLLPGDASPPPRPAQDPAPTHATFTGTVHDALNWPVNGARIQAVAAGGLKPFELAKTTADNTGVFSLIVPFAGEPVPAKRIRIQVLEQSVLLMETEELALTTEVASKPLRLALPASAGSATTRFELVCTVRSTDGAPLCGVPVQMYSRTSEGEPRPGWNHPDSEVLTTADGVARLTGRTPGSKVLFADGRKLGLRTGLATVDVGKPGEHHAAFTLAAGKTLQARIITVDDKLLEWANVWLEEETTRITHNGKLGTDGSVEFPCLGDGPVTLRVSAHPHSPVARRGLLPGGEPVAIRIKRSDDVRDHGDHMAEVHGKLVDATGAVVPFGPFDIEVLQARKGESTLPLDLVEPPPPAHGRATAPCGRPSTTTASRQTGGRSSRG